MTPSIDIDLHIQKSLVPENEDNYWLPYKKQRDNPVENQAIFPDSHEHIIEDEVFEKVQQIRQQRHRKTKSGRSSMFSGLVYCSDCGEKLYYGATNNYRTEGAYFP